MDGAVDRVDVHRGLQDRHLRTVLEVHRDRVVAQIARERALPVMLHPRRVQGVE